MVTVETPFNCSPERDYILSVVLGEWLGVSYRRQCVDAVGVRLLCEGGQLELADTFFEASVSAWLDQRVVPESPLPRWDIGNETHAITESPDLPLLYFEGAPHAPFIEGSGRTYRCRVDLFGSIFFLLSRYEEVVSTARDGFGRCRGTDSLAVSERYLERPIANEYLEVLWALLHRIAPGLRRRHRTYKLNLSHDVDSPSGASHFNARELVWSLGADILKRHLPSMALRRCIAAVTAPFGTPRCDPHNTFDFIMSESERIGVRSAFYFICGHTGGRIDGVYDLEEPWVRALVASMYRRGHEIGLHPSFETWKDGAALRAEFRRLKRTCSELGVEQAQWGGRQHFLRWAAPVTWRLWSEAGLSYDSSVGYADRAGFRSGTCYEHTVFDLENRQALPLVERPLVAMEVSLIQAAYMGLSLDAAVSKIIELGDVCRRHRGDMTVLWHNHFLIEPVQRAAYHDVVTALI